MKKHQLSKLVLGIFFITFQVVTINTLTAESQEFSNSNSWVQVSEDNYVTVNNQLQPGPSDCYQHIDSGKIHCVPNGPKMTDTNDFENLIWTLISGNILDIDEKPNCTNEQSTTISTNISSDSQNDCDPFHDGKFCYLNLCFSGFIDPAHNFPPPFSGKVDEICVELKPPAMDEVTAVNLFGDRRKLWMDLNLGPPYKTKGNFVKEVFRYKLQWEENKCTLTNPSAKDDLKCNQAAICPRDRPFCIFGEEFDGIPEACYCEYDLK